MFRLLFKYLILNKRLFVPGIGTFFIERKPAKLDFANKVFAPPAFDIGFTPRETSADTRLQTFISHEQKIDEPEAGKQYENFVKSLKKNLAEHRVVELPGMGVLSQNEEGGLSFKATEQLGEYLPAVAAERVMRENTEHHILVGEKSSTNIEMQERYAEDPKEQTYAKDQWWIFAIALGIIGIATIVYYYLHNGSLQ